jgi:hypothetical protein
MVWTGCSDGYILLFLTALSQSKWIDISQKNSVLHEPYLSRNLASYDRIGNFCYWHIPFPVKHFKEFSGKKCLNIVLPSVGSRWKKYEYITQTLYLNTALGNKQRL